jgi:hypothetical protein
MYIVRLFIACLALVVLITHHTMRRRVFVLSVSVLLAILGVVFSFGSGIFLLGVLIYYALDVKPQRVNVVAVRGPRYVGI